MADKDNNKAPRVEVKGKVLSELSLAGMTRRIWSYTVNIQRDGSEQPRTYDRELHICEREPDEPEPEPDRPLAEAAIPRPPDPVPVPVQPPAPEPEIAQPEDPLQVTGTAIDALPPDHPEPEPDAEPIISPVQAAPTGPSRWQLLWQRTRRTGAAVQPGRFIRAISRHFPRFSPQLTLPDRKIPSARRLFTPPSRHYLRQGTLLVSGIMILAGLFYYLSITPETITASNPPSAPASKPSQADAYHAVIEKQADGILITIQGPQHEEVLTKLPPGYHPIVQDNKIVHVVTRGNTLWFIAKRYIKNPYRYPELARLNKIKNPDLIYPGDKVVIQHIRKPAS